MAWQPAVTSGSRRCPVQEPRVTRWPAWAFSTDGRLEGGPCEYDHRSLKKWVPFQTNFHLPSSGTGCLNINGTKTKLLVETETEFTEAAKARLWAQAKLVNEEARVHEMKKQIRRMRAPVEDDVEMHFGDKMTEDNTRFRGSTRQSYGSAGSRGRMSRSSTRSMPMRTRQSNWSEAGGKKSLIQLSIEATHSEQRRSESKHIEWVRDSHVQLTTG